MDDKLKFFWNLDVLVKMCRSKSDGPSLRIEEDEIIEKIDAYNQEIEELKTISEEEIYDTSAEMADRNIEIITKKQLQSLKTTLKEKNKELNSLKEEEQKLYSDNSLLRENKLSQEKYISSMQERINEATDYEVIDRYNGLIAETTEKISALVDELEEHNNNYERVQHDIVRLSEEIASIEEKIDKKKKLLAETQSNLENKDNYVDKTKKEKTDKKIEELKTKIKKATLRLSDIRKDPKYMEYRIKDIINNKEDIETVKPFLIDLINTVIKVPYINVPADNTLEEELLKATQARDSFANEIEQKSYNILETSSPEKIRIDFLNERIALWTNELEELKTKVDIIDRDREHNYEAKNQDIQNMLESMKKDLSEYERAYEEVPEMNVGAKASLKAAIDEKKIDIIEAEKIITAFKKDESDDIARATRTVKYECERLNQNIQLAENEIESIKNRLTSKKSGIIDIGTKNKDKDTLKELAQTVIDIKHRRQFPETPLEILKRLEEIIDMNILMEIDTDYIEKSSYIIKKDYEEYDGFKHDIRRGIKVVEETEVETNIEEDESETNAKIQEAEAELQSLINDIEEKEKTINKNSENEQVVETLEDEIIENTLFEQIEPEIESYEPVTLEGFDEIIKPENENKEEITKEQSSIINEGSEELEKNPSEETILEELDKEEAAIEESLHELDEMTITTESKNENNQIQSLDEKELTNEDVQQEEESSNIILENNIENDEEQPLDIDAIFTEASHEQNEEKNDKDLSIDTIFNEKTNNDNSNEELADDFEKYINDLENKDA